MAATKGTLTQIQLAALIKHYWNGTTATFGTRVYIEFWVSGLGWMTSKKTVPVAVSAAEGMSLYVIMQLKSTFRCKCLMNYFLEIELKGYF